LQVNISVKSIKNLVDYGHQQISALSDSDSAKLDAQILLSFVLNKPCSYLLTWPDLSLEESDCQHFYSLLERRTQGEPIAYIIGTKDFWSLTLSVSPATLIPRPDTETLVEHVLIDFPNGALTCLDLGTGTGAIALALASEKPRWHIDAVDFSADAVLLAQKNAKDNQLPQVNIYQSDWFKQIAVNKSFDLIVSNPPYIENSDNHLSQGDVRFEPKSALVAKQNGLSDLIHIIDCARNYFNDAGALYLEHGFEQAEAVQQILAKYGYENIATLKDLAGNDRVTKGLYFKLNAKRRNNNV